MTRVGTVLVSGAEISVDYGLPLTSGLLSALAHRYPADSAARRQADMSDAWLVWLLDELQRTTNLELDFEELLTSIHACMVAEREGAVFDRLPAERRSDDDRWPGRKHDWVGHTDYPWVRKFGLDPYRLSLGGDPAGSFRLLVKGLLLMLHERGWQRVDQYGAQLARDAPDLEGVITTNYDSLPEDVLRDERAINYGFTEMRSVFSAALAIREISKRRRRGDSEPDEGGHKGPAASRGLVPSA